MPTIPSIPTHALDMHTAEGQKKVFFEEALCINPEVEDRDRTYLERIMKMLDAGELKD